MFQCCMHDIACLTMHCKAAETLTMKLPGTGKATVITLVPNSTKNNIMVPIWKLGFTKDHKAGVWPASIDLEELWKNMTDTVFDSDRGGARFEWMTVGSTEVVGQEIADSSLGYVDGLKKALVIFTFITIIHSFVAQPDTTNHLTDMQH